MEEAEDEGQSEQRMGLQEEGGERGGLWRDAKCGGGVDEDERR
jgi:hypothetical protein